MCEKSSLRDDVIIREDLSLDKSECIVRQVQVSVLVQFGK